MQKAGKYEILRKIGAGGFGVVYEGRDPFIKRRVAIKTCTTEDEDVRQRFFREAEIAGNLQHKNIVTIHDFGFEEGVPYLVQEFLAGEDLSQIIARKEPLSLGRKLDLLLQVAHGMAFAHGQGVIHRDIKPNNVRVLEDWRAKIMDFGIAKLANVESHLTKEGMTVGTAAYLPPEQIRGDKVDTRADIFSFGVLAYELLTYSRPFDGKTLSTLLYQILSQEPKPLGEVWPEAPPRVSRLVASCLEKEAAKRCPTFETVESELAAAIAEASVVDETNLIRQQTSVFAASPTTPAAPPAPRENRAEVAAVGEKVRRAIVAGDLTAAELELTLAEKSWGRSDAFRELVAPLKEELAGARTRQEDARRRKERLQRLLERGVERLDAGEFAEARVAFEAALELDPASQEGVEGISRADAGMAWLAAEALRAAEADGLVRAGLELLSAGDLASATAKARDALALQPDSPEASRLLAATEERGRAVAAEEARRKEEERRARAAAEAEQRRLELEAERQKRLADEAASREKRKLEEAAELERRRQAEAAEFERRRQAEAEARERRRQEMGGEIDSALAAAVLVRAEKLLAKAERELGVEALTLWRERVSAARESANAAEAAEREERIAAREAAETEKRAEREAKAAEREARIAEETQRRAHEAEEKELRRQAAEREREAKRAAEAEAEALKAEERRRQAAAKADLARAKTLEATAGTQLPSASFASAKLSDPQTLKWIGGAAASLGVVVLGLWLVLGRAKEQRKAATSPAPPASTATEPSAGAGEGRPSIPPGTPDSPKTTEIVARTVATSPSETPPAVGEKALPPTVTSSERAATGTAQPPSMLDQALASARSRLAAGDRAGALAALTQAQSLSPGDLSSHTLLNELAKDGARNLATARRRALAAGADRFASAALAEAEREAQRASSLGSTPEAIEAVWSATKRFEAVAREAAAGEQRAAAEPASPPATEPNRAAPIPAPQKSPATEARSPAAVAPPASVPPKSVPVAPPAPASTPTPAVIGALTNPSAVRAEPAPSAADPIQAIRATLERYRAANEALDVGALGAVWQLDESAKSQIARAFAGYNSLSMTFEKCSVEVDGEAAVARCKVAQRIDVKVGSDIRSSQNVTFELRRSGERWTIRSRTAK